MMTKEGFTIIVNFMAPGSGVLVLGGWPYESSSENELFLKNPLLHSQASSRQNKYEVMMIKEGSTKIVNFMRPRAVVLMLGVAIQFIIVNMCYRLLYQYITLIKIVLRK